ncbi:hypothetical protein KK141_22410 [Dyella sp. LX-66]|nr:MULTISPECIES: hypothetical protein [unclassified Dyella]MBT2117813.1 hypothetical protein [Dyella sp. LX-1]MBT2142316.1 hypothetical protein [Dyella sp. LX-66]
MAKDGGACPNSTKKALESLVSRAFFVFKLVPEIGIEPTTYALRMRLHKQ